MIRVIDTGIRGGRENVAFDQALVELHAAGRIPDTVRFLRFRPSALVGRHQILSHEARLEYCARHGIEVGRRITGGGGLYLDEGQVCWELVLARKGLGADLAAIAARICAAAAAGLRRLGVPAEFRPRNDIEARGRKLSGTGGLVDGRTLFFQGTLLVDFDPARMIEALRVPVEKLARRDLDDARKRVTTVKEILGFTPSVSDIQEALLTGFREQLGLAPQWGEVTPEEEALARRLHDEELGTEAFVRGPDAPGGEPGQVSASLVRRGGALYRALKKLGNDLPEAIEILTGAATPVLDRWFESPELKGTLATDAIIGSFAPPSAPGSG